LHIVTYSIDCAAKGLNPFTTGACNPWGVLYNYPSFWLHLGTIGVSSTSTNALGVLFVALLCATLLLIYDTRTVASGILAFSAVIAPPILTLMERGNIDILMFAASVLTVMILAKQAGPGATLVQSGVFAFLAVLKIYPVAGATVLAHRRWGFAGIMLTGLLAVIGLLGLVGPKELTYIALNTPQSGVMSYGDMPIFLAAKDRGLLPATMEANILRVIASTTALTLAGISILFSLRHPGTLRGLPTLDPASTTGAAAMACISVFCFSFLLGSNYFYRLVFLLGVLPVLLTAHDIERQARTLVLPGAIVVFLWASRASHHILLPFEALDWSLFVVGVMWLTKTVLARRPQFGPVFDVSTRETELAD
jgi:hypothetical protein